MDRQTPEYIILKKTNRDKPGIEVGTKAIKFEKKIMKSNLNRLFNTNQEKEIIRKQYHERNWYAAGEVERTMNYEQLWPIKTKKHKAKININVYWNSNITKQSQHAL